MYSICLHIHANPHAYTYIHRCVYMYIYIYTYTHTLVLSHFYASVDADVARESWGYYVYNFKCLCMPASCFDYLRSYPCAILTKQLGLFLPLEASSDPFRMRGSADPLPKVCAPRFRLQPGCLLAGRAAAERLQGPCSRSVPV